MLRGGLVAVSIALITCLLVKVADIGLDMALPYFPPLYPKNSEVRFRTYDYDAVAHINAFGFRGSNTEFREGQIIVVGDSFTFGLGVGDDDTWPRRLEQRLQLAGDERQVYNLGAPGTDTLFHIELARDALEKKPQVLILSVLLADDIQQVFEAAQLQAGSGEANWRARGVSSAKAFVRWALPGSFKLYRQVKYAESSSEHPGGAEPEARPISESLSEEQFAALEIKVASFPADLREAVLSGMVNFGFFQFAERFPDRSWRFWEDVTQSRPDALATAHLVETELAELAGEMAGYGGRLVILAMPSGEFVRSEFTSSYRMYGADIPESNMSTLVPEQRLAEIAVRAGAEFVPSLEEFRRQSRSDPFFPTDGHMNTSGNSMVAEIIADYFYAETL